MTKQTASEYILDTSRDYSLYVCQNRAIPMVTDGLKDGQRKALWVLRNKGSKIKTVAFSGEIIAEGLYLHGDVSLQKSISMLAAPFCNNIPLIEGHGNFGKRTSPVEGIAAPRYTSVRRSEFAKHVLYKDLEVIELKDNYDGSTQEPVSFLPIIPTVLLNSISGIAVGWSTEILPRDINDLINATLSAIDGKKVKRLVPTYSYLDVTSEYLGENSWNFYGKIEILKPNLVKVTELPPDTTLEKFKSRLIQMEEDGKISDFIDRSTKHINIEIKLRRGTGKNWTEQDAIKFFKLKNKKTERIVVLNWDAQSIRQYENAEDLVVDFVEWRFGFYVLRYKKKLANTKDELNFWKAIKLCFDNNLPGDLTKMKDKKELEKKIRTITALVALTDSQIDRISSFASYRWAKDYYKHCKDKIKEMINFEKEYTLLLKHPDRIRKIFRAEVVDLKQEKFAK